MKTLMPARWREPSRVALDLSLRVLAATFGGYAVAASLCAVMALLLPMSKADSTLTATMLSFAIFASAIIYAFSAQRTWHVWAVFIAIAATGYGLQGWLLGS